MLTHYFLHSIAALLPNLQSGKSHLTDRFLPYHRNHSLALLYPKQLLLPSPLLLLLLPPPPLSSLL